MSESEGSGQMAGFIVFGTVMLIWVLTWDATDERSA